MLNASIGMQGSGRWMVTVEDALLERVRTSYQEALVPCSRCQALRSSGHEVPRSMTGSRREESVRC
jgi:hypothetical protein